MTADSSQMFDNDKMSGSEGCGELDWFNERVTAISQMEQERRERERQSSIMLYFPFELLLNLTWVSIKKLFEF